MMIKTPWFYGWNVVALAMLFQALTFGIGIYSATFWVVPWSEEFTAPRGDVLRAMMFMNIAMGLIAPLAGRAMDRLPIGTLVCCGAAIMAIGLALVAASQSLWQVIAIYATLMPVGLVLAGPLAAQTLAAKWFQEQRGLAIGISSVGTSVGGFLIPPLVTALQAGYGWRVTHLVLAVMVVALIIPLTWLVLQRGPATPVVKQSEGDTTGAAALATRQWTTAQLFRERAFWAPVLAFVPLAFVFSSLQLNFGAMANDVGITDAIAAAMVSFMAVAMIGGKLFFGGLSDRWDHRVLYWITAAAMLLGVLFFRLPASTLTYFCAMALLGIAAGGFLPLMGSIVASRFGPAAFGQVQGLIGPFMTLGALGPPFTGWIYDQTGSYAAALDILALVALPGAIAMYFLPARQDQTPAPQPAATPAPAQLQPQLKAPTAPGQGENQDGPRPQLARPGSGNDTGTGTADRRSSSPPLAP